MTDYGRPFVGSIKTVEDDWIDYNGHFNMAYYGVLFDRTCDEAFDLVGLGSDYLKTGASFFTLETHTTYVRELHADDKVKGAALGEIERQIERHEAFLKAMEDGYRRRYRRY